MGGAPAGAAALHKGRGTSSGVLVRASAGWLCGTEAPACRAFASFGALRVCAGLQHPASIIPNPPRLTAGVAWCCLPAHDLVLPLVYAPPTSRPRHPLGLPQVDRWQGVMSAQDLDLKLRGMLQ